MSSSAGLLAGAPERFLSTDSSHSDSSCTSVSQLTSDKNSWESIKIFDISNPRSPKYVATVETDCGSHTHRKQALTSRFNGYRKFAETRPFTACFDRYA